MKKILTMVILFSFSCAEDKIEPQVNTTRVTKSLLPFRIVEKKDVSYAGTPRMVVRVLVNVEKIPIEDELKRISDALWTDGNTRWAEFTVFLYLPEMNIHSIAYGIGEYRPSGLKEFKTQEIALFGTKWYKPIIDIDDNIVEISRVKDYTIALETSIRGRTLTISVNTNLPDGTKLLIGVKRIYWEKGDDERYAGEIFSEDIVVENGKIKVITKVDDRKWKDEYRTKQIQFAKLNLFPGINRISPKIKVSAMFSPYRNKGNKVLDILGKEGEFMSGKNIRNNLGFNILEATKEIKISIE
ncbi:MAG: hypothetical protein IH880_09155 [Candidatus Marinimicrobia bacterium]|nr:hypothetical protein [Candidatus Neomarinimicrobiota bacterium]